MSSTIGVFLVEREPSHRSLWQANHAISLEQNIFSKIHTMQIFKSLQGTLWRLTLGVQTRYVAASVVTDRRTDGQTHTHTHRTTTVTLWHMHRGLMTSLSHCRICQPCTSSTFKLQTLVLTRQGLNQMHLIITLGRQFVSWLRPMPLCIMDVCLVRS